MKGRNYKYFDDEDEFFWNNRDIFNLINYEDWEWEKIEDYSFSKKRRSK